jgi:hypothetical protein
MTAALPCPIRLDTAPAATVSFADGALHDVAVDPQARLGLTRNGDAHVGSGRAVSPAVDLGAARDATISWRAQWLAPQRWQKHPGNPIYGPAQSGDWDEWTNGVAILRNADNATYKMFYCGRRGSGIGFAEAAIADPLVWTEHPTSPVLRGRADNWEGDLINQPRVVKVTDSHWRMYYTGWGLEADGSGWAIGLAESHDEGVTWARVQDDPILARGDADSPDGGGAFVPDVHFIDGRWHMWYTAMRLVPEKQYIHICYATSDDGVRWQKHPDNPVLTDDFARGPDRNVISRCHVRHVDGVYGMWYSHARPDYRIRYAESRDGVQ